VGGKRIAIAYLALVGVGSILFTLTMVNFCEIGLHLVELWVPGVILGILVWLAGRALGAPRATYYHGIMIVTSAIILTDIISYFLDLWGIWARTIELVIVVLLIRHIFSIGWGKTVVIGILVIMIVGTIIAILLSGFTVWGGSWWYWIGCRMSPACCTPGDRIIIWGK
jgi:hypothetical protein